MILGMLCVVRFFLVVPASEADGLLWKNLHHVSSCGISRSTTKTRWSAGQGCITRPS